MCMSDSFIDKLYVNLKGCIPFLYEDNPKNEFPDFSKPYLVETSWLKNRQKWSAIKKTFKNFNLKGFEWTYNNLADNFSKEMFIFVVCYKILGNSNFRFPFYYSSVYEKMSAIQDMSVDDETITLWFDIIKLKKHNLAKLGYGLLLWSGVGGITLEFLLDQYNYRNMVKVEGNDIVLDCGGCYGDTALHFAHNTSGKVYSFEFIPENINIFKKNLALNPKYADQVVLTSSPLGIVSGEEVYAVANGPGTNINAQKSENTGVYYTVSIDDFVEKNHIEKIDFIKMDIEGSEEKALKGARETIKKYKPKLAICAYHKEDDLIVLPRLIKELVPEYKLYLKHNTCMNNETVLFAAV